MGGGRGKGNPIGVGHDVWGNMAKFRGVITHSLSPFEQRAFAGMLSHGAPNMVKRIRAQLFKIGIPVLMGVLIYDWAEKEHERLIRKDPVFYDKEYHDYLASPEHQTYLRKQAEEAKEAKEKQ